MCALSSRRYNVFVRSPLAMHCIFVSSRNRRCRRYLAILLGYQVCLCRCRPSLAASSAFLYPLLLALHCSESRLPLTGRPAMPAVHKVWPGSSTARSTPASHAAEYLIDVEGRSVLAYPLGMPAKRLFDIEGSMSGRRQWRGAMRVPRAL
jgi:hypothetical protein